MLIILPKLLSTQKWVLGRVWGEGKRDESGGKGEVGRRGRGKGEEERGRGGEKEEEGGRRKIGRGRGKKKGRRREGEARVK